MFRVAWWMLIAWSAYWCGMLFWDAFGLPWPNEPTNSLIFYGATYAIVARFARNYLGDPWADLVPLRRVSLGMVAPVALVTLGGLVLGHQLVVISLHLLPPVPGLGLGLGDVGDSTASSMDSASSSLGVELISTALLPGIFEEASVRGIVLHVLSQNMTKRRAIVISSLFFAVLHLKLERMADTFFSGLVYGWMFVSTGSLLPGILAHTLHNAVVVLLGHFGWMPGSSESSIPVDSYGLLPAWMGWAAVLSMAGGLMWIRHRWWRWSDLTAPPHRSNEDQEKLAA